IGHFLVTDLKARDKLAAHAARLPPRRRGAPCNRVVLSDDLIEGGNGPVVHVGRGHGHVAQTGGAKTSPIAVLPGELDKARVVGRVAAAPVHVVETGVVEPP
ncbi:hypothetical protein RZS08_36910, partial [Arthrospira platensis SPKY1]|nr:hypothetical protein [Arthrospira platensis SPKY1]